MEVGIDFGTTFSTVCFGKVESGTDACLSIAGSIFIPTEIFVADAGWYSIGGRARSELISGTPGNYYANPKRWVGANKRNRLEYITKLSPEAEVIDDGLFGVKLGGVGKGSRLYLSVTSLIYLFIKACVLEVQDRTSQVVSGVVCSVPANYNSYKRSYLATALGSLGLPLRALINEPTAAALYGVVASGGLARVYGVFDFGGGTFDVSFVYKRGDVFGVIGSEGDNYLGGRDIDRAIAETVRSRLSDDCDDATLRIFCADIKERVSANVDDTRHLVLTKNGSAEVTYTREDLISDSEPYLKRAIDLFEAGCKKLGFPQIVVVLTGGSSALPGVSAKLRKVTNVVDVIFDLKTFRASVALGAKTYSDILSGQGSLRLVDSLSQTLSDELTLFQPSIVFTKGGAVPNTYKTSFTISGGAIPFGVFEGEHPITPANELTFKAIYNNSVTGRRTVETVYTLTVDGRLSIVVDGTTLINELVPPSAEESVKTIRYMLSSLKYYERGMNYYLSIYKAIYGQEITEDDVNNNKGGFLTSGILKNYTSIINK